MTDKLDMYEEGRQARQGFITSQGYMGLSRNITAKDAMKVFLPPVPQDMMQVQRPLPAGNKKWINGWEDAKADEFVTEVMSSLPKIAQFPEEKEDET